MAELPYSYFLGDKFEEQTGPEAAAAVYDMFSQIAQVVNAKPSLVFFETAPTTSDIDYNEGTIWVDQSASNKVYFLVKVDSAPPTATWVALN